MIFKKYFYFKIISIFTIFFIISSIYLFESLINEKFISFKNWESSKMSNNQLRIILENLKNEKAILIFGTSRANQISSEILNFNTYNLHYVYSYPKIVLDFLENLDEKQINNIKKIYFLIDYHTIDKKYTFAKNFDQINIKNKFFWIKDKIKNLNLTSIYESFIFFYSRILNTYNYYVDENGSVISKGNHNWDGSLTTDSDHFKKYNFDDHDYLRKIQNFTKKKKIEIIFFTPIFSNGFCKMFEKKISDFVNMILLSIDEFHMFLCEENISNNNGYFVDESHLNYKGILKWFSLDWNARIVNKYNKDRKIKNLKKNI